MHLSFSFCVICRCLIFVSVLNSKTFSEDDWKLVQLVLTLFRNILAVQDISAHQKASGSASLYLSLRDDFLDRLFRENVMDLIIIITQHVGGSCRYLRHDNLLLLEIYHHVITGQDAELIAKICQEKSKVCFLSLLRAYGKCFSYKFDC